MSLRTKTPLAAAVATALVLPLAAHAAGKAQSGGGCFLSRDWDGWSAAGRGDALYLRVRQHEIWRVDLTPGTRAHKAPDDFLVNRVRGSGWICGPLDLDLAVSDYQGFRRPLLAEGLRKLTPAEVAAIPKKDLP
jgi:hypothetical protein